MATGLKKTSSTIIISGSVTESAANVFTQATIDLQLNPLDNEVFVVEAVDINVDYPDNIPTTSTNTRGSLSNTSRTTIGRLDNSNVFATVNDEIRQGAGTIDGAAFQSMAPDSATASGLEYIAILATDNFFAAVDGSANLVAKVMRFKVYGYRAKASSSTYAALVQSELLSS